MRTRSLFPFVLAAAALTLVALCLAGLAATPSPTFAESLAWVDLQGPRDGAAQAIAFNPAYPADQTVLGGAGRDFGTGAWAGLGIFRSADGGRTWPYRAGQATDATLDVAFSPDWQTDGFAAAAQWRGLWLTRDRGATWQQVSGLGSSWPSQLSNVAVSRPVSGTHTVLVAGSSGGMFRSANEGRSWSFVPTYNAVQRLRFSPTDPALALCACSGLWRSTDAGLNWTRVLTEVQAYDVAFTGNGQLAFAVAEGRIWRSPDAGLTWQAMAGPKDDAFKPLGVSADGLGLFAAAGATLYRYDIDAGQWAPAVTDLNAGMILRLAVSPAFGADHTLLVGTVEGVWISTDGGATFTPSQGFAPFKLTVVRPAPDVLTGGDLIVGGDYGLWRRTAGAWQRLRYIATSDRRVIADAAVSPAYSTDGTLFVADNNTSGIDGGIYKSTNRGATWRQVFTGIAPRSLAFSPAFTTDRRLFFVDNGRVYQSTDGGETFTALSFWDPLNQYTYRVAVSTNFTADHTVIAVTSKTVFVSQDGGATWQAATQPPPLAPTGTQSGFGAGALVAGPGGRFYLTLFRYDNTAPYTRHDQVWRTSDHGVTWQQVPGVPDLAIAGFAAGPGTAADVDSLYVATYQESFTDERATAGDLYVTANGGQTWRNLGATPGGTAWALAGTASANTMFAGTLGAYQLDLATMPTATPDPCSQLLLNRSIEVEGVWRIPQTAYPAQRNGEMYSHGFWSMRTGITGAAANVRSYSDFSQDVTLPAGKTITLRFDRWPTSGVPLAAADLSASDLSASDLSASDLSVATSRNTLDALDGVATVDEFYRQLEAAAGDFQYGMVIAPPGGKIKYLFTGLRDDRAWIEQSFDLSAYAGQTVRLQFGTYNDGAGPVAAQYFDNFRLDACGQVVTPSPTPAPRLWLPSIRRPNATYPPNQW